MNYALTRLSELGLDISRIDLEPQTNTYHARYLDIDLALDSYPYTGGGTTCDTLYMGVPLISLYGKRRGSRFSYGLMEAVGVGELTAGTVEEYIEKAVALANDTERLTIYHKTLRAMMINSPVMDSKLYITELEAQYKAAYQKAFTKIEDWK